MGGVVSLRLSSAARPSRCSHIRRFPYLYIAEFPANRPSGFPRSCSSWASSIWLYVQGTVKLAESKLGRGRVARVNGRDDDDGSRPDLRWLSLPAEIISYAVWLYFRFLLSLRMVEEMHQFEHPGEHFSADAEP